MALDDFFDSEVGIAVAATAVAMSPRVRSVLRRGAVYGLAGLMRAGDTLGSAAKGVAGEAQQTMASAMSDAQSVNTNSGSAKASSRGGRAARTNTTE